MTERYIGLMSGTSLDGVDTALVSFPEGRAQLLHTHYQPYPRDFRNALKGICSEDTISLQTLGCLDARLGVFMGECINALLKAAGINHQSIRAIGSHGQTLYHCPEAQFPFSLQIGDPNRIAQLTGITTVADFRRRDIAAGGQGAPLVPGFHRSVFSNPEEARVIVNVGGIANITILPKSRQAPVLAFDTGPGNALMDYWAEKHLDRTFDHNGDWADSGELDETLLTRLRADPYFAVLPPKSTGKEYFSAHWLECHLNRLPNSVPPANVQRTLARLTAETISGAICHFAPDTERVLVCGGGAHNSHIMKLIAADLDCPVQTTACLGIDPDYIEAMAFAWLAKQTLDGKCGNVPSATGASAPVVLGGIYPAGAHF